MAKLIRQAIGLAMPWPAMSGAEPWTGSYIALRRPRGVGGTQRGRGQHAEAAGQHGGAVGEDVAEQIVGDDDVELLGRRTSCMAQLSAYMWSSVDVGIVAVVQRL